MSMSELRRTFAARAELEAYLRERFAAFAGAGERLAPTCGAAVPPPQRLAAIDPARYARTRNHLDGAVTGLSPWVRHGVVTLAELRDRALVAARRPEDAEKLVSELGWRDYWQRVMARWPERLWADVEPYKTGFAASDYAPDLPDEVVAGRTGLACIDAFAAELAGDGWLHNHARLWLAAYVVHWLHVRWQAGARWFLAHLLDGDLASNNLSWQWVASTFSAKPYFFNRANLERHTDGRHCRSCGRAADCPFAASYPELEARLFPRLAPGTLVR